MENKRVYITILSDSLEKKLDVLKKLLLVTKEQNMILARKTLTNLMYMVSIQQ